MIQNKWFVFTNNIDTMLYGISNLNYKGENKMKIVEMWYEKELKKIRKITEEEIKFIENNNVIIMDIKNFEQLYKNFKPANSFINDFEISYSPQMFLNDDEDSRINVILENERVAVEELNDKRTTINELLSIATEYHHKEEILRKYGCLV